MSLETMQNRLNYTGGSSQQNRMIWEKQRTLKIASKHSYQAAHFSSLSGDNKFDGVMNPVTHNMDYDTKMISTLNPIFKVGDIFYWEEGRSYWICYARDITELAYFRGECRKCNYSVQWVDKDRNLQEAYISAVGPTLVNFSGQNIGKAYLDLPNSDLTVLISDTPCNDSYFHQYQTFVLRGLTYEVVQIDNISMPGIMQLNCRRTYSNRIEDNVEEDISNVWNVQPIFEHYLVENTIVGYNVIKPLFKYYFDAAVPYADQGYWVIEDWNGTYTNTGNPYSLTTKETDKRHCSVTWTNRWEGNFTLCYYRSSDGKLLGKRFIVVESLL